MHPATEIGKEPVSELRHLDRNELPWYKPSPISEEPYRGPTAES